MSLVTEAQIRGMVLVAEGQLDAEQAELWADIRIEPEVWSPADGAEHGVGFWVIARHEGDLIWYDSLAEEFRAGTTFGEQVLPEPVTGARTLSDLLAKVA
jgi:hypothetical protein